MQTHSKIIKLFFVILQTSAVCIKPVFAEELPISGDWEVVTNDINRFYGTISAPSLEGGVISYTFVYNSKRINSNENQEEFLRAIGDSCYSFYTRGEFYSSKNSKRGLKVILCENSGRLFWSLLDQNGSLNQLPNWAVLQRVNRAHD